VAAAEFAGVARNWDDELEHVLADAGYRLERTFGKWRRGKVRAYVGLRVEVSEDGTLLECGD
jgi:hypothetical protein